VTNTEIGALVRVARERAGYKTRYAFCQATGISAGQLSLIERGVNSPTISTLERIMDAIGWEVRVEFRPVRRKKK
jgi:transcriptional regulator with XRE-family HTH domain